MSIDEIYKISKGVGTRLLRNRKPIPSSYQDIAHDVYIKYYEGGGGDFSKKQIVKLLFATYREQIEIQSLYNTLDSIGDNNMCIEKVCTKCGENKYINEFTLQREKAYQRYSSLCNKCRIRQITKWQSNNPIKEKDRKAKTYQNNKALYRNRNIEARNNLVDWYIKARLVACGMNPNKITPEMIAKKRQELMDRRFKRYKKRQLSLTYHTPV